MFEETPLGKRREAQAEKMGWYEGNPSFGRVRPPPIAPSLTRSERLPALLIFIARASEKAWGAGRCARADFRVVGRFVRCARLGAVIAPALATPRVKAGARSAMSAPGQAKRASNKS